MKKKTFLNAIQKQKLFGLSKKDKAKKETPKENEEEKREYNFRWTIPVKELSQFKAALARFEAENPGSIQSVRFGPPVKPPETKDQLN